MFLSKFVKKSLASASLPTSTTSLGGAWTTTTTATTRMVGTRSSSSMTRMMMRPTTLRLSSSATTTTTRSFHASVPSFGKVEILQLSSTSTDGDDSESTSGILKHVLGVGTPVHAGDPIAVIQVEKNNKKTNGDTAAEDSDDEITIYAPYTGRITNHIATLKSPINVGDVLLELSDDIVNDRKKLQQGSSGDSNKIPEDILHSDDVFRLQQYIQSIREIAPQLYPKCLSIYQRILELQQDPNQLEQQAMTRTELGSLLYQLGDTQGCLLQLQAALDLRNEVHGGKNREKNGTDTNDDDMVYHPHVAASYIYIAAVQQQVGNLQESLQSMLNALKIQKKLLGNTHMVVASSMNTIGTIYYQMATTTTTTSQDSGGNGTAVDVVDKVNFQHAIDYYQSALQIYNDDEEGSSNENGADTTKNVDLAGTHHNLGVALKFVGEYKKAIEHCQKALQLRREILNSSGDALQEQQQPNQLQQLEADIGASHYSLGQIWSEIGEYDGALEQFMASLSIQEKLYGTNSHITATSYNNIGSIHYQQGNYDDALTQYQKGLSILQNLNKDTGSNVNPNDLAGALNNVGLAMYRKGNYDESLNYHQQAKTLLEDTYGKDSPNLALATTIGSIGNVYKSQSKLNEALDEFKTAHTMLETILGTSNHPDVASSFNNMGLVLSQQGNYEQALKVYQAAKESFTNSLGNEHPHTGSCHYNIGLVLKSMSASGSGSASSDRDSSLQQAKEEFQKAKEIWESSLGPQHPHTEMAKQSIQECSSS